MNRYGGDSGLLVFRHRAVDSNGSDCPYWGSQLRINSSVLHEHRV